MFDIIIVGAGPAGLTSALYALRANKKILVLDGKSYGGQIINASLIQNYPGLPNISGYEFAHALYKQVKDLGGVLKIEKVLEISTQKKVITNKNEYQAKSIIIATGLNNRKLEMENEDKLIGKGISYCATCDGNLYKNQAVAVIGGGSEALEDTLYLSDIATKVYLINRNNSFDERGKTLEELQKRNNVQIIYNARLKELIGKDKLEKIVLDNGLELEISGLFIAMGKEPKNDIFKNIVNIDNNGFIESNGDLETKTEGIFVAGDARKKSLRQLTTAVADGSIAATEAIRYINK